MPPRYQRRQGNPYNNYGMSPNYSSWMGMNYGNSNPGFYQGRGPMQSNSRRPSRGGGGFLSRLLGGRGQTARSANPFQFGPIANTRTSGIPSWLKPDSISRFVGQTQQILHTGHQIGGMVQQYGPIIKNLPALWKIYRSVNTSQENKEDSTNQATALQEAQNKDKDEKKDQQNKEHLVLTDDEIKELENDEFFQDFEESKEDNVDDEFSPSINRKEKYREKQSVPKLFI